MKAIETVYNGYRFRSRLEARWAVFFDHLGIKYEYEKEGFDLGKAGWYLPDFCTPTSWVEIKSHDISWEESSRAHDICLALSATSDKDVLLIRGSPWPDEHSIIANRKGETLIVGQFLEMTVMAGIMGLAICATREPQWIPWEAYEGQRLQAAYAAARQARFEHGERGMKPAKVIFG
jgi:hypothetical protein